MNAEKKRFGNKTKIQKKWETKPTNFPETHMENVCPPNEIQCKRAAAWLILTFAGSNICRTNKKSQQTNGASACVQSRIAMSIIWEGKEKTSKNRITKQHHKNMTRQQRRERPRGRENREHDFGSTNVWIKSKKGTSVGKKKLKYRHGTSEALECKHKKKHILLTAMRYWSTFTSPYVRHPYKLPWMCWASAVERHLLLKRKKEPVEADRHAARW